MKKLKIMLLSFALLAIVGGALAFKAKFNEQFCTAITNGGTSALCAAGAGLNKFCPNDLIRRTDNSKPFVDVYCYTTPQQLDGDPELECIDDDGLNTLRCITTTTSFYQD